MHNAIFVSNQDAAAIMAPLGHTTRYAEKNNPFFASHTQAVKLFWLVVKMATI